MCVYVCVFMCVCEGVCGQAFRDRAVDIYGTKTQAGYVLYLLANECFNRFFKLIIHEHTQKTTAKIPN